MGNVSGVVGTVERDAAEQAPNYLRLSLTGTESTDHLIQLGHVVLYAPFTEDTP